MNLKILEGLGAVAGVAGVALGLVVLVFRQLIARKIFPKLTQQQSYRLLLAIVVSSWSIAVLGIVSWLVTSGHGPGNDRGSALVRPDAAAVTTTASPQQPTGDGTTRVKVGTGVAAIHDVEVTGPVTIQSGPGAGSAGAGPPAVQEGNAVPSGSGAEAGSGVAAGGNVSIRGSLQIGGPEKPAAPSK